MAIVFSTSKPTVDGRKMHTPSGALSVEDLPDFDAIKTEDLEVGTSVGADPSIPRTFVDPNSHTYIHGSEGVARRFQRRS